MSTAPRRESRNRIAAGAFFAVWSLAGWWSFFATPTLYRDDYGADPGPALLPVIVLAVLSAGALLLIVTGLRQLASEPGDDRYWRRLGDGALAPTLFVGSLLVYVVVMNVIGYLLASALLAFVWIAALGFRHRDGTARAIVLTAAVATLVGVGAIYVVFVMLIGVPVR